MKQKYPVVPFIVKLKDDFPLVVGFNGYSYLYYKEFCVAIRPFEYDASTELYLSTLLKKTVNGNYKVLNKNDKHVCLVDDLKHAVEFLEMIWKICND